MKDGRLKPLGEFLTVCPETYNEEQIDLNIDGVPLGLRIDDLLKGEADLNSLEYCADPMGKIISAIATKYKIDEILLKPYEAAVVANPIVVPPHGWSPEDNDKSGGMEHRSSEYGADYYYPKQHLVGASLYPVFFQVAVGGLTPPHEHTGTETLMVMNGNANEVFKKCKNFDGRKHPICAGKVLHYPGEIRHCTVNKSETDVFQAWAFRELKPIHADANRKQTEFMVGLLGGLLRTWRLVKRKAIRDVALGKSRTKILEDLENGIQVPWLELDPGTESINEDKLKQLGKMYGIGEELISVFGRKPAVDPVEASSIWPEGGNINPANMNYHKPSPGIFFYWPESILVGSTIHPVLLQLAPFSRTQGHSHPGSEILLIIQGEAKVEFTENQTVIKSIKAGQLAQFDGSWHHSVENIGGSFLKAWVLMEFRLT